MKNFINTLPVNCYSDMSNNDIQLINTRSISCDKDILPKDISDALKQLNNDMKAGITNPETTQRLYDVLYKGHSGGRLGRTKTRRRRR